MLGVLRHIIHWGKQSFQTFWQKEVRDLALLTEQAIGAPLGLTLGQWLRRSGPGSYTYQDGVGTLALEFSGFVPNGVYTMWHAFMPLLCRNFRPRKGDGNDGSDGERSGETDP